MGSSLEVIGSVPSTWFLVSVDLVTKLWMHKVLIDRKKTRCVVRGVAAERTNQPCPNDVRGTPGTRNCATSYVPAARNATA